MASLVASDLAPVGTSMAATEKPQNPLHITETRGNFSYYGL